MVKLYFGLPGAGKSSALVYYLLKISWQIENNKKCPYVRCVSNVQTVNIPHCFYMEYSDMITHDLGANTLILIDEGTLQFDNRNYKNFSADSLYFFLMHRHFEYDIMIFTQQYNAVDLKIRSICDRVYYIKKGKLFSGISHIYPVKYGVIIPQKKDKDNQHYGEIIQGYCRWSFYDSIFHTRIIRKSTYGLYNTFCRPNKPLASYLQKQYKKPIFKIDNSIEDNNKINSNNVK